MNKLKIYLLLTILLASLITACAKPASQLSAAELLDLGEKYLLEMNYEQAVVCFTKLIAIEPKNPRGYTGLAEAYVGLGEFDKALEVLRQGLGQLPDNVEIAELLDELEAVAGDNGVANPATKTSSGTEVAIDVHLTAAQLAFLKPLEEALLAFDLEAAAPILASAEFYELCRSLPKKVVDVDENYSSSSFPIASYVSKYKNVYKIDNHGIWLLKDGTARSAVFISVIDNLENGHEIITQFDVVGYDLNGLNDVHDMFMNDVPIVNGYVYYDVDKVSRGVLGWMVDGKFMRDEDYYEYEQSQLNR